MDGDLSGALKDYSRAINLGDSKEADYYNKRASLYWIYQKDYERAIQDYKRSLEIKPENNFVFYGLSETYIRMKDYERGIRHFNELAQLYPQKKDIYEYQ